MIYIYIPCVYNIHKVCLLLCHPRWSCSSYGLSLPNQSASQVHLSYIAFACFCFSLHAFVCLGQHFNLDVRQPTTCRTLARFKRRHLYLASAIATIISLAAFGTTLLFATHLEHWHIEEQAVIIDWSSVVFGCILVFCVNLGVQPMANLMTSELFPAEVRAFCKVSFKVFILKEQGK